LNAQKAHYELRIIVGTDVVGAIDITNPLPPLFLRSAAALDV